MSNAFRTVVPDSRRSGRFGGHATFCRYPRLEDVEPTNAPVDWALYGAPYDGGVSYRPGTRFGPRAIRDASQYVKHYHMTHGLDVRELLSLADAGDAPVRPYSPEDNANAITEFARTLADAAHTKLLLIGGDHSTALANMRATHERRGKPADGMAVLHFDSHLDTVDTVWGEKYGHASPFIRAVEEGVIDPAAMLSVGIKGPLNTRDDLEYARDRGVRIVTYDEWCAGGQAVIDDFVRQLGDRETYLSFDIDCVDPAYAPGTGTPSVGGFTSAEILRVLRSCKGANVVGADVVEVLPDRDLGDNTALLAAHVAFEILCLDAARRR